MAGSREGNTTGPMPQHQETQWDTPRTKVWFWKVPGRDNAWEEGQE